MNMYFMWVESEWNCRIWGVRISEMHETCYGQPKIEYVLHSQHEKNICPCFFDERKITHAFQHWTSGNLYIIDNCQNLLEGWEQLCLVRPLFVYIEVINVASLKTKTEHVIHRYINNSMLAGKHVEMKNEKVVYT